MSGTFRRAIASVSAPVAGSSKQLSTTASRYARGSNKKRVVNPDAMELNEATRILRALEIGNPSSAYSVTLQTHHSKSSLPLRGRVSLPLDARRAPEVILVFAEPNSPSFSAAQTAGAHIIGGEELFAKVLNGDIQPTKVLTTPSMLPGVQRQLARFLGPKGLMPSPKRGGVGEGEELGNRIREAGGTLEWKADKLGVIRAPVARVCSPVPLTEEDMLIKQMTFDLPAVQTNIRAFIAAVREQAATASAAEQSASSSSRGRKPSGIVTARLETTHGPSIEINDI